MQQARPISVSNAKPVSSEDHPLQVVYKPGEVSYCETHNETKRFDEFAQAYSNLGGYICDFRRLSNALITLETDPRLDTMEMSWHKISSLRLILPKELSKSEFFIECAETHPFDKNVFQPGKKKNSDTLMMQFYRGVIEHYTSVVTNPKGSPHILLHPDLQQLLTQINGTSFKGLIDPREFISSLYHHFRNLTVIIPKVVYKKTMPCAEYDIFRHLFETMNGTQFTESAEHNMAIVEHLFSIIKDTYRTGKLGEINAPRYHPNFYDNSFTYFMTTYRGLVENGITKAAGYPHLHIAVYYKGDEVPRYTELKQELLKSFSRVDINYQKDFKPRKDSGFSKSSDGKFYPVAYTLKNDRYRETREMLTAYTEKRSDEPIANGYILSSSIPHARIFQMLVNPKSFGVAKSLRTFHNIVIHCRENFTEKIQLFFTLPPNDAKSIEFASSALKGEKEVLEISEINTDDFIILDSDEKPPGSQLPSFIGTNLEMGAPDKKNDVSHALYIVALIMESNKCAISKGRVYRKLDAAKYTYLDYDDFDGILNFIRSIPEFSSLITRNFTAIKTIMEDQSESSFKYSYPGNVTAPIQLPRFNISFEWVEFGDFFFNIYTGYAVLINPDVDGYTQIPTPAFNYCPDITTHNFPSIMQRLQLYSPWPRILANSNIFDLEILSRYYELLLPREHKRPSILCIGPPNCGKSSTVIPAASLYPPAQVQTAKTERYTQFDYDDADKTEITILDEAVERIFKTGNMLKMTAFEPLTTERKGKDPRTTLPTSRMFITTNDMTLWGHLEDAMRARLVPLLFKPLPFKNSTDARSEIQQHAFAIVLFQAFAYFSTQIGTRDVMEYNITKMITESELPKDNPKYVNDYMTYKYPPRHRDIRNCPLKGIKFHKFPFPIFRTYAECKEAIVEREEYFRSQSVIASVGGSLGVLASPTSSEDFDVPDIYEDMNKLNIEQQKKMQHELARETPMIAGVQTPTIVELP